MLIKRGLGITTKTFIENNSQYGENSFQASGDFKEISGEKHFEEIKSEKHNFDIEHFIHSQIKTYEISGDFELNQEIKNSTQTIIIIKKDSKIKIKLDGENNNFLSSGIHFQLDEGVVVEIYLDYNLNGKQNYLRVSLNQEKNSQVKFASNIKTNFQTLVFFETNMNGERTTIDKRIFLEAKDSEVDVEILVNQNNEDTTSNLVVNGTLENSRIINENTIRIPANSHGAKGFEHSKFVLLDENSTSISIPNLEIETNDVVCSHGSTITKIDEKELFYLQTRGLSKIEAINLIRSGMKEYVNSHLTMKSNESLNEIEE